MLAASLQPPRSRTSAPRVGPNPCLSLSVHLLQTYTTINTAHDNARARHSEVTRTLHDAHGNYVPVDGELLHSRYRLGACIGHGSFGRVFECVDATNNRRVAVKIVKCARAFVKQAAVELRVLQALSSDHCVHLLDSFTHHKHPCFVFERLSLNLYELLKNTSFQGVSLNLVAKFGQQLLRALQHLHDRPTPIIHCDLKPENVLLLNSRRSLVKLIDFGSACFQDQCLFTYVQSRYYRAPEVLLGLGYARSIDLWSLGCVLVELYTGHPIFDGACESEQLAKHISVLGPVPSAMVTASDKCKEMFEFDRASRQYQLRNAGFPATSLRECLSVKDEQSQQFERFLDLIGRLLHYQPEQRLTPADGLRHPFFDPIPFAQSAKVAPFAASLTLSAPATMEQRTKHEQPRDYQPTPMVVEADEDDASASHTFPSASIFASSPSPSRAMTPAPPIFSPRPALKSRARTQRSQRSYLPPESDRRTTRSSKPPRATKSVAAWPSEVLSEVPRTRAQARRIAAVRPQSPVPFDAIAQRTRSHCSNGP